jgi:pectate lyase
MEGRMVSWIRVLMCFAVGLIPIVVPAQAVYEGFGATTQGGTGQPIVHVTNLNESGAGSLAAAVSASNRYVVFDVGGTIDAPGNIQIHGLSNITIDGTTAPAPGITLQNGGLIIESGAHDIIVKNIRVRNSGDDAFRVFGQPASFNIVFDHISAYEPGDGAVDITENSNNVTVQYSILRISNNNAGASLVGYGAHSVTYHHNLLWSPSRNPRVDFASGNGDCTLWPGMTGRTGADVRNNIIWNWGANAGASFGYGVGPDGTGTMNVVNNFFQANGTYSIGLGKLALNYNASCSGGQAYTSGNVHGGTPVVNVNTQGNVATPFTAPQVTTEPTCTAAAKVLQQAGARPLDSIDQTLISQVSLVNCPGVGSSPSTPTAVQVQ